jgi:hypothetical protein
MEQSGNSSGSHPEKHERSEYGSDCTGHAAATPSRLSVRRTHG